MIRAAGSGVSSYSPDLLAFKKGLQYALECKAVEKRNLSIDREQFVRLQQWEENTGITTFVAWRKNREPWLFIPLSVFSENQKTFGLSWEKAKMIGRKKEELLTTISI